MLSSAAKLTSDKVEDVEKFIETMPAIEITTNKGLDMRNTANNFEGFIVKSDGEQINGSISVTGNSKGFLAVIDKAVLNDITLKNTKSDGIIILLDKGTLNSTKGSITLDMGGEFLAGANIWANRDINITSRNGSITVAKLKSLKNGETTTETTDNIDTLKAIRNINLKAAKTIEIEGQVTSGRNITAKSSSGINIIGKADVNAGNNIEIGIDEGNLAIAGKIRANNGEIVIDIDKGDIKIGNETTKQNNETVVFAKRDINMTTNSGIINISGNIKSASDVRMNKENQNALKNANVAENDSAETAMLATTTDEPKLGDIIIDAEVEANDSVWIATDEGNIRITKLIKVNDGDIIIATQDGDISITSNHDSYITGQKGITVEETGAINPGKDVYLNATNGDIERNQRRY